MVLPWTTWVKPKEAGGGGHLMDQLIKAAGLLKTVTNLVFGRRPFSFDVSLKVATYMT